MFLSSDMVSYFFEFGQCVPCCSVSFKIATVAIRDNEGKKAISLCVPQNTILKVKVVITRRATLKALIKFVPIEKSTQPHTQTHTVNNKAETINSTSGVASKSQKD